MAALADSAYLIRNKYSCHIPGAGWCQVFDCYATLHVRERPGLGHILRPCFSKFKIILNEFFLPSSSRAPLLTSFRIVMCVMCVTAFSPLLSLSLCLCLLAGENFCRIVNIFRNIPSLSELIFFISVQKTFYFDGQNLFFAPSIPLAIIWDI